MKNMTNHKVWRVAIHVGLAAVMAAATLFLGVTSAFAAAPEQDGGSPFPNRWLERAYQREQMALDHQGDRLEFAALIAGDVREWIDYLKEQGEDVDELEEALANFNAGLADAQAHHDDAAAILSEHEGFDEDGKVVDRPQAVDTLRRAGRALRDAHRALSDATADLHTAIRDWRYDHRPRSEQPEG